MALQAGLAAFLAVLLALQHGSGSAVTVVATMFVVSIGGLVLAQRSMKMAVAKLETEATVAAAAREHAEAAARRAHAERERAAKLEATLLQVQRFESMGRLAGGVAHDFNNLLTVIGASASMAERAVAAGASPSSDLQEIHLAVGRAAELTRHLLALARKQVLVKKCVDLNELVSTVSRMSSRVIGDIRLSVEVSAEPLRVLVDAGQVEQVLIALLLNARDAVSPGGHIEIRSQRCLVSAQEEQAFGVCAGDYACIEVRDDGSGMTEDVQRRLFEPFFTTKLPGRGTGLGLATAFGIVRQHEGTIRVESRPQQGTLMQVVLPLAAVTDVAPTSGVQPVLERRRRVLVVEDEPQVRAIAARALSAAGFEVHQAASGDSGLAVMQTQSDPFDVVVTDVIMPGLSGPELARAARQLDPDVGLVFMSGFPEAMASTHVNEFAGAGFLAKPFSAQALVQCARERVPERRVARSRTS